MKRSLWILLVAVLPPALLWANPRKMTVAELQDVLAGLHHAQKSDEQIADQLKQIELTEELTPTAMNQMVSLVRGPLSTEQMYVLEARSAILAPPDTDLPKLAPPDAAAQQTMLAKAQDYAAKTYPLLPRFTASRLVARFQDGAETIQSYGSSRIKINNDSDPLWAQTSHYVRLRNTQTDKVEIDKGIEKPGGKDTTPWGRNGLVNSTLPFLPMDVLTGEAVSVGKARFLRWETIEGHQAAVFTFSVEKKKSDYAINYCCFPDTSSVSSALYGVGSSNNPSSGSLSASPFAAPADNGNFSYVTDWNPFKAKSAYHGELFLDPDSGAILRTIVEAKFKPSDFVHYEDIRVDYAPVLIGRKTFGVPVRSFTIAEVVPNGSSFVRGYGVRHQFVLQQYRDFRSTDGTYQEVAFLNEPGKTTVAGTASTRSGLEGVTTTRGSVEDADEVPAGGFPALENLARPADPLVISGSGKPMQRPSDDEIKSLLAKAAESANSYWDSLPNFTCQQVTDRFDGSRTGSKWEPIDRITGQLNYYDHQEDWEFEEYEKDHRKSHDSTADAAKGLTGFGIFGGVIRGLFRPTSKAELTWFQSEALGNHTVQVFQYRVAKENSNLYLRASSIQVVASGYHGMVYIDSETGEVRRITQIADDVPKGYPIYQTLVSTDYDYVSVGGQRYLLPVGAQIVLRERRRGRLELNRLHFADFHRFRSTSRILSSTPVALR